VPLLLPTLGLIAGVGAGHFFADKASWWPAALAGLICIVAALRAWRGIAAIFLFVAVGWMASVVHRPASASFGCGVFSGTVTEIAERESSRRMIVEIDGFNGRPCPEFLAAVTTPAFNPPLDFGQRVTLKSTMEPLRHTPALPDETDYTAALRLRGVTATAYVRPADLRAGACAGSLKWSLRRMRGDISRRIFSSGVSDTTGALINTLLTGDGSMLSADTRDDYAAAGLAHVLALSGLHVGIIAWLIAVALWPLYLARMTCARLSATMVILWAYVAVTGFAPSVTRAAVMASVFMVGRIIQRESVPLNSLCLAAIIILIADPAALLSIGFQLSFAAVAAIIVIVPLINRVDRRAHPVLHAIAGAASASAAAVAGTGLIAAYYFHTYPLYFLIANLAVALLLTPLLAGSVLLVVAQAAGGAPLWLCGSLDFVAGMLGWVASAVAQLPGSAVRGVYVPAWSFVPYFAILAAALMWLRTRRNAWGAAAVTVAAAWTVAAGLTSPRFPDCEHFVVGESDCTNIIVRERDTIFVLTTALPPDTADVMARCRNKYVDYAGRRGVLTIKPMPAGHTTGYAVRSGRILSAGNRRYALIDDNSDCRRLPVRVDAALVCRGFTGDVVALADSLRPDTVILARDLNRRRHDRYLRELRAAGIPVRTLRSI